ncbi:MAG: hypothetical protein ABTD50_17615 [Polyangiaceae bacterium]
MFIISSGYSLGWRMQPTLRLPGEADGPVGKFPNIQTRLSLIGDVDA